VAEPCPPPTPQDHGIDPRIRRAQATLDRMDSLAPEMQAIHPMGAELPQECVNMLASSFMSVQYSTTYNLNAYPLWLLEQDMSPAYRWHRQFLQHLQSGFPPGRRWVLKTPGHLGYADVLLDTYPDAGFIQTHREPMEVMASLASLVCHLRGAFSHNIDPPLFAARELSFWSRTLVMGMAARDRTQAPGRFFDLRFVDFMADTLGSIEAIYQHFGLTLETPVRQRMETYLHQNPSDRHGRRHRYRLEDFGLDRERDGAVFEDYRSRFGLQPL